MGWSEDRAAWKNPAMQALLMTSFQKNVSWRQTSKKKQSSNIKRGVCFFFLIPSFSKVYLIWRRSSMHIIIGCGSPLNLTWLVWNPLTKELKKLQRLECRFNDNSKVLNEWVLLLINRMEVIHCIRNFRPIAIAFLSCQLSSPIGGYLVFSFPLCQHQKLQFLEWRSGVWIGKLWMVPCWKAENINMNTIHRIIES